MLAKLLRGIIVCSLRDIDFTCVLPNLQLLSGNEWRCVTTIIASFRAFAIETTGSRDRVIK